MSDHSQLIEQLQKELDHELTSRKREQELNAKLQDEYDILLKKLAAAELHIDKLRLGANVELNKWYILRHSTEQTSTLRQRLEAEYDPANQVVNCTSGETQSSKSGMVNSTERAQNVGRLASTTEHAQSSDNYTMFENSDDLTQDNSNATNMSHRHGNMTHPSNVELVNRSVNTEDNTSFKSQISNGSMKFQNGSLESTNTEHNHSSRGVLSDSQISNGSIRYQNGTLDHLRHNSGDEGSCDSELSLLLSSVHSTSSHHAHSDSDDLCISQMSDGSIATCGGAESMQLSHLLRIHALRGEIAAIKSKINTNDGGPPLDEIVGDLHHVQDEHRQLVSDVEASTVHLKLLKEKYRDRPQVFDQISKSQETIANELSSLSVQLRELGELLQSKSSSFLLQGRKDHDDQFYDSLNSPSLPTKYLNHSTTTEHCTPEEPNKKKDDQPATSEAPPVSTVATHTHRMSGSHAQLPKHLQQQQNGVSSRERSSSNSGTQLEELLEAGIAGGSQPRSCEDDTLSELSDIFPSDDSNLTHSSAATEAGGFVQEAKRNLEHAERLGFGTPLSSQLLYSSRHPKETIFPRETDSGFAGSEFPSRAGNRSTSPANDSVFPFKAGKSSASTSADVTPPNMMSTPSSVAYHPLVVDGSGDDTHHWDSSRGGGGSMEAPKENTKNSSSQMSGVGVVDQEKLPSLTAEAIDSLRNELATLKEQILQTVEQQKDHAVQQLGFVPKTPYTHSHSATSDTGMRRTSKTNSETIKTQYTPSSSRSKFSPFATPSHSNTGSPMHSQPQLTDRGSLISTPKRHSSIPNSTISFLPSSTKITNTPTRTASLRTTPFSTPHHITSASSFPERGQSSIFRQNLITNERQKSAKNTNSTSECAHRSSCVVQERDSRSTLFSRTASLESDCNTSPSHDISAPRGGQRESPQSGGIDPTNWLCPECGEPSIQVSSKEITSRDGKRRHKRVTYVHSCRGSPKHEKLTSPKLLRRQTEEQNGVESHSKDSRMSFEGSSTPVATSTPSRAGESRSRNAHTQTLLRRDSDKANVPLRQPEPPFWNNISPPSQNGANERESRHNYDLKTHSPALSSSSHTSLMHTSSSPSTTCTTTSAHSSPTHTYTTAPTQRRGSAPLSTQSSPATSYHTSSRRPHNIGATATPTFRRKLLIHPNPVEIPSHSYRSRSRHPTDSSEEQYDGTPAVHKKKSHVTHVAMSPPRSRPYMVNASTRSEFGAGSVQRRKYHLYESRDHHRSDLIGRESPSRRRKVVEVVPAVSSENDEYYYSEPHDLRVSGRRRRGDGGDGVRRMYVKPRSVHRVYMVESDGGDSGSDDEVEAGDADVQLDEVLRLAKQLKRKSKRMQSTLHAELNRRGKF